MSKVLLVPNARPHSAHRLPLNFSLIFLHLGLW